MAGQAATGNTVESVRSTINSIQHDNKENKGSNIASMSGDQSTPGIGHDGNFKPHVEVKETTKAQHAR